MQATCMAVQDKAVDWRKSDVLPDGKRVYKIIVVNTRTRSLVESMA